MTGGVDGQLVARAHVVELRADLPDEGYELVLVAGRKRLEVDVDAVGAAVPDGRGDLPREVRPGGRATEEPPLPIELARRPAEALDREHDPGAVPVGVVDDVGHPRARPAAPSHGRRPVGVALLEIPLRVDPDAEKGDGRE